MKQMSEALAEFWNSFGGRKNNGIGVEPDLKMAALKRYVQMKFGFKKRMSVAERRTKFERVKKRRHNLKSHAICFVCGRNANVRHHIIQIAGGATNAKRNLVSLCTPCHDEVEGRSRT